MASIKLVSGDTAPEIDVELSNGATGVALDLSDSGDAANFHFRRLGAGSSAIIIPCSKPNGGVDGVVRITWPSGTLDSPGEYEGEIEVTFSDGKKQTIYEKLRFTVRKQMDV